jgi:hypothetical protein
MHQYFIFGLLIVGILAELAYYNLLGNFVKLLKIHTDPTRSKKDQDRAWEIAASGEFTIILYQLAIAFTVPVAAAIFIAGEQSWVRWFGFVLIGGLAFQTFGNIGWGPTLNWAKDKDRKLRNLDRVRSACIVNACFTALITLILFMNKVNIF